MNLAENYYNIPELDKKINGTTLQHPKEVFSGHFYVPDSQITCKRPILGKKSTVSTGLLVTHCSLQYVINSYLLFLIHVYIDQLLSLIYRSKLEKHRVNNLFRNFFNIPPDTDLRICQHSRASQLRE